MNYYAYDRWNSPYLDHHGIKGMKWGVRHDYIPIGRKRKAVSKSTTNNRRGLSKNAKRALKVGAIAAGAVLVAAGGYYLYRSGKLNKGIVATKDILGKVGDVTVSKTKEVPSTATDISKAIKPQAGCCNFNSFAASLEGSGNFDISLKPGAADKYIGNTNDLIQKALKNPDSRIHDTVPEAIYRNEFKLANTIMRIAKGQEGACGQISSGLKNGKGHAFNWKIEGGQVKFFDTYGNKRSQGYTPIEDASTYMYNYLSGKDGKITRLDGLTADDLNLDFLKQYFNIKPR